MRPRFKSVLVVIAVIAAAQAFAFTGSIVTSWVNPHGSNWPKGIDYAGGYLYHGSNYSYNRLYVTTTTGSIVNTITSPSGTMGVDVTGSYIWTCSYSPATVYQMTTTGSIITSFSGPAAGYGIASDGTYLWYSSATSDMIYRMTTAGQVLNSFSHPGSFAGDLDYANGYLWISDWPSSNGGIYQVTTTGSLVDSMVPAVNAARPAGVCHDGTYLWYSDYNSPYYTTRCRIVFTGIAPISFGKVKVLFR